MVGNQDPTCYTVWPDNDNNGGPNLVDNSERRVKILVRTLDCLVGTILDCEKLSVLGELMEARAWEEVERS